MLRWSKRGEVVGAVVGAVLVIVGEVSHDHELVRVGLGFLSGGFAFHAVSHHVAPGTSP